MSLMLEKVACAAMKSSIFLSAGANIYQINISPVHSWSMLALKFVFSLEGLTKYKTGILKPPLVFHQDLGV